MLITHAEQLSILANRGTINEVFGSRKAETDDIECLISYLTQTNDLDNLEALLFVTMYIEVKYYLALTMRAAIKRGGCNTSTQVTILSQLAAYRQCD